MTKEYQDEILAELVRKLATQDLALEADGTPTLTVKLPDGTFRKKPAATTAYFPLEAYVGSRDVIFCFSPEDPQEWVQAEVSAKDVDTVFPLFLAEMQTWVKQRFMPVAPMRGKQVDETTSVRDLTALMFKYAEDDMRASEEADDSAMASLPTFGMF